MPGPFHGIDLSSRALRSFQRAMDVTGHNIANVNTRGYSRQVVDFSATDPLTFYSNGAQSLGTGVQIGSINRMRAGYLDNRMGTATSDHGKFDSIASSLREVQSVYQEPGEAGVSKALDKFFDSWSALASNPNEGANRLQVRAAGQTLADRVRGAYQGLTATSADLTSQINDGVAQITNLGRKIDALNKEIRAQSATGASPTDLLDQRDSAVEALSQLTNLNTTDNPDGTKNVYISQFTLVDSAGSGDFPTTFDAATQSFTGPNNQRIDVKGGSIAGWMVASQKAQAGMTQLDNLANGLKTAINSVHQTGTNPNGTSGLNFFDDVASGPQTGASNFDISVEVKADAKNIANSVTGTAGDGGLALALSQVRNASQAALGNKTFHQYHSENMLALSSDVSYYKNAAATQGAVMDQIDNQRQSISGVNLDDEMSNLLRYQRSYQAAAKALSIFDQVTEDIIGMIRR